MSRRSRHSFNRSWMRAIPPCRISLPAHIGGQAIRHPVELAESYCGCASTAESASRCFPFLCPQQFWRARARPGSADQTETIAFAHARHPCVSLHENRMPRLGGAASLRAVAPGNCTACWNTRRLTMLCRFPSIREQQKEVDVCTPSGTRPGNGCSTTFVDKLVLITPAMMRWKPWNCRSKSVAAYSDYRSRPREACSTPKTIRAPCPFRVGGDACDRRSFSGIAPFDRKRIIYQQRMFWPHARGILGGGSI